MRRYFYVILILALVFCGIPQAWSEGAADKTPAKATTNNDKVKAAKPLLSVSPKEIDLGAIAPGTEETAVFNIKNLGAGAVNWTLLKPEGWFCKDEQKISGTVEGKSSAVKIRIKHVKGGGEAKARGTNGTVQLYLETDTKTMNCKKELAPGSFRETIKIASNAGTRSVFVKFKINPTGNEPVLEVNPQRMDFGAVNAGEQVTRRLALTNKGRDMLKWSVDLSPAIQSESGSMIKKGRYISFFNVSVKGFKSYSPSQAMKESLENVWTLDGSRRVSRFRSAKQRPQVKIFRKRHSGAVLAKPGRRKLFSIYRR